MISLQSIYLSQEPLLMADYNEKYTSTSEYAKPSDDERGLTLQKDWPIEEETAARRKQVVAQSHTLKSAVLLGWTS